METKKDFDMVDMPAEGVAAYWLAIRKLVGNRRNPKVLEEESAYTTEPYIRYLLDVCYSGLEDDRLRLLGHARRDIRLEELGRKLDLMRMTLMDIATGENPRKTLAKMTAKYNMQSLSEEEAFRLAQDLFGLAGKKAEDAGTYFNVHHRVNPDQLVVTLLFYTLYARREGKRELTPFMPHVRSPLFAEGLALVVDGFDAPFLRKRLRVHRDTLVRETRIKMDMSLELCLGIRRKLEYDDVFKIAQAYL